MLTIFNTNNSKTRDEALNIIINQMTESLLYIPIAYNLDESLCSCCLYESFELIYKIGNEYKILYYDGYIKHLNTCAIIRCSCKEPFIWKNINPKEKDIEDVDLSRFETFTSINDNILWYDDFKYFFKQKLENKEIYKYNEDEIESVKNYSFYFI